MARRPQDADIIAWQPGDPVGGLPPADAVVALWGVTPGAGRDLSLNTTLALAAMDLAQAVGARRVLHCSSAAVYPGGSVAACESDAVAPWSPYGVEKARMEAAVADWTRQRPGGPRACCLRMANVAGADSLFAALDRGGTITLDRFPDGQGPRRSYLAPGDLAQAIGALLRLPAADLPEVVNLAGPTAVAMADVVRAAGQEPAWRPAPEGALPVMALSDRRGAALFGPLTDSADPARLVAQWRALGKAVA